MTDARKRISEKYCPRFGQVAVDMGFITEDQARQGLCRQLDDELAGKGHRLLGTILFDMEAMSAEQIEAVLNALLKQMRAEQRPAKSSERVAGLIRR